ncbi:MAG: hypothetical protein EHM48_05795 [Planctomycetaceae bacterium]|nr:MAG: hypothetical protein EHM48_05795 [Planctomycetaceae bacterium]
MNDKSSREFRKLREENKARIPILCVAAVFVGGNATNRRKRLTWTKRIRAISSRKRQRVGHTDTE